MFRFLKNLFGKSFPEITAGDISSANLKEGALYSVYSGDESNQFGVVKILKLEPPVVHICSYRNSFATRPEQVDPATLTCGFEAALFEKAMEDDTLDELFADGGPGIAHMPISLRDFFYGWQPVYLMDSTVLEEELEGYEIWKREGGGVWGNP